MVDQGPLPTGAAGHVVTVPSVASGAVHSGTKFAGDTRSALLTNQPCAVDASNWTAESTTLSKSYSGGMKCSGSRKKLDVKRESKTIKKSEKNCHRSDVVSSPEKNKIKILVSSATASTASASTGASSTREVPIVEVNNAGAL